MRSSLAKAFSDAVEHHAQGRLSEAEAGYRSVLQHAPDQPDALHRLGIIAHQVGRNEIALELIDRASTIDPAQPTYHNDAGIVLHALGRIDESIARYRQALALDHAYPRAHNGLGIALHARGRLDDAIASFRMALSLKPDYADAHNNLANVLREQGRAAEAVQIYRQALETRPDLPDAWYNLAIALRDLRAFDDAAKACTRALLLKPDFAEARAAFVESLVAAELRDVDADVRQMALRALATPWARPSALSAACIRMLASDATMRERVDRAWNAWPARLSLSALLDGEDHRIVFDDILFRTLLESAPVCDLAMERFLTLARSALLHAVVDGCDLAAGDALGFCCALARQCFINDYVFASTDAEIEHALALRNGVVVSLERGEAVAATNVAVVAAYFPLLSLPRPEMLLARSWPPSLDALLTQQLREPLDERHLRHGIRRLTAIEDQVSISVRGQYEEHPYPRWVKLPSGVTAHAGTLAHAIFPLALRRSKEHRLDILVAGCGTGQESIEIAQAFPGARVLAIDLSLASLAYAERKARELGVANIEHAQADIMSLASLGRSFDVISSVGVLHHLADPIAGWRQLLSMLAADGCMLVGLYSERSRQDVVAAQAFIAARGYGSSTADIRRCRQDLLSVDRPPQIARLALRTDFYTTAECRDLLFHVQEHRFTLPQIAAAIDTLGLRFNGFLLEQDLAGRYAEQYPDDPGMENLGNWDRLEAQLPQAFAGMYIFRVQKAR